VSRGNKAHADDILTRDSNDPIKLPTPGKSTQTSGEEWETQGACVRENPGVEGCYLSNAGRENLLRQIHSRANAVRTNYKIAATELKTTTLLKRDSDFSFIPTLYKEFLIGTLLGALTKGVIHLRGGAKDSVEIVTDDAIRNLSRTLGGQVSKRGDAAVKQDLNKSAADDKRGRVAYLDIVQNDIDAYFDALLLSINANATDAQLQVIYDGLAPSLNNIDVLRSELAERLQRFVDSDVLKIGRGWEQARGERWHTAMDRRVVRVQVGKQEQLFYQHHEFRFGATDRDDPFGVNEDDRGKGVAYWGKPVPDEFRTQALAASEAKWGPTPLMLLPPDELRALTGRAR